MTDTDLSLRIARLEENQRALLQVLQPQRARLSFRRLSFEYWSVIDVLPAVKRRVRRGSL